MSYFSGKKEERNYENGVLNGPAVIYGTNGDKFEFTYVDGVISGEIATLSNELTQTLHG